MSLSLVNIPLLKISSNPKVNFFLGFIYSLALFNLRSFNWLKLANANISTLLVCIPIILNMSLLVKVINRQGSKLNIII